MTTGDELPVAVVGAGFSGTLLAINLLRAGGRVVLIERDGANLAKGVAFGTRHAEHLLNVRAANMGAYPDDPSHFLRWMGEDRAGDANRFVPRRIYGAYLRDQLRDALASAPGRLTIHAGRALDAVFGDRRVDVCLDDGAVLASRALVLAPGNFAPSPPPPLAGLSADVLRVDPWAPDSLEGLDDTRPVLLVGSGLTAIDMAISLDCAGFRGQMIAVSRRGLVPRAHAEHGPHASPVARPAARGAGLLRHVRQRSRDVDWRQAVDELRPHTQALWRLHDRAQQARYLRHLRPWWDVHRHRLAPPVAERVARLQAEGRLTIMAGRILSAREEGGQAVVTWRARGGDMGQSLTVGRIILCTGPESDITRCGDPLMDALIAQGLARPDQHRLGLDVDHDGRLIGSEGRARDDLFAVGPMTKGAFWEIVAVPDIRRQVWSLARTLTNTQWVAGEGL